MSSDAGSILASVADTRRKAIMPENQTDNTGSGEQTATPCPWLNWIKIDESTERPAPDEIVLVRCLGIYSGLLMEIAQWSRTDYGTAAFAVPRQGPDSPSVIIPAVTHWARIPTPEVERKEE